MNIFRAGLAAGGALLAASAAQADTVTVNGWLDGDGTVGFAAFDSSLGALYQVRLNYDLFASTTLSVMNYGSEGPFVAVTVHSPISIYGPGSAYSFTEFLKVDTVFAGAFVPVDIIFEGSVGGFTDFRSVSDFATAPSFLFQALPPTAGLPMDVSASLTDLALSANGPLSLTYFYQPAAVSVTPEPAAWAMMVLGFGAVGMAARRRRSGSPA